MPGELRIPHKLLITALSEKATKELRLFAAAKLYGHRVDAGALIDTLEIHPRTGRRLIKRLTDRGWAGYDGTQLFPRGWRHLGLSKRGGLYMTTAPIDLDKFEALCFAKALQRLLRKAKTTPARPERGRTSQSPELSLPYLATGLGLKERRFKYLKARAQKYGFLRSVRQYRIIGEAREFSSLRRNLHDVPMFRRGAYTVTPDLSKITMEI